MRWYEPALILVRVYPVADFSTSSTVLADSLNLVPTSVASGWSQLINSRNWSLVN